MAGPRVAYGRMPFSGSIGSDAAASLRYQRHHGSLRPWGRCVSRPADLGAGLAGRRGAAGTGVQGPVPGSGRASETDRHGLAAPARRVINPGFHFGCMLPGGAALKVNRIGDVPWSRDALVRTGERIGCFHRARAIDAREAEPRCVIAGVCVLDVEVDLRTCLVRPGTRDLGGRRGGCRFARRRGARR